MYSSHTHTQITSLHLLNPTTFALFQPFPSEATPYLINAHIGTHVTQRHVSQLVYRLGPTFLFEEQVVFSSLIYTCSVLLVYCGLHISMCLDLCLT